MVIFESFWATQEALWLSQETEAVFRANWPGESGSRCGPPAIRWRSLSGRGRRGEAVELTLVTAKPTGVADVVIWVEVLDNNDFEARAVDDYCLVLDSARKLDPAGW